MLENLNNEIKIGLIVLIVGGLGFANHKFNKHKIAQPVVLVLLLLVASYGIYMTITNEESFEDVNNPPTQQDNTRCYSEGQEIDCEQLDPTNNAPEYNSNNIHNQSLQEQDNDNESTISGSYGVERDSSFKEVDQQINSNQLPNECYPKDILSPKELLPTDNKSTWAQSVPAGQGSLGDQNFLNAGFHIGINTVGQTLRNPNYGLRSEPPNPQVKVSPWMQTTIEPDTNRRAMEINA